MTTDDLIFYIQNQLKKNVSKDLIVSRLTDVGWNPDDIEEGFAKVSSINTPISSEPINVELQHSITTTLQDEIKPEIGFTSSLNEVGNLDKTQTISKQESVLEDTVIKNPTTSNFLDNKPVLNLYEINQPEEYVELNQINPSPSQKNEIIEKIDLVDKPVNAVVNSLEIEASKNLQIDQNESKQIIEIQPKIISEIEIPEIKLRETKEPKSPELKIWTPMQIAPLEKETEIQNNVETDKIKEFEEEIPQIKLEEKKAELEPEVEKEDGDLFGEFIPKLIEKKLISSVEPIIKITPATPNNPVSPITIDKDDQKTKISAVPKKEFQTVTSSFQPTDSLNNVRSINYNPRRENPSGFLDLSGGNKIEQKPKNLGTVNLDINNDKSMNNLDASLDLSKKAMIASYSADYISANLVNEKSTQKEKIKIPKSIIVIIIILILLGALTFGLIGGYFKIPNINFSFIRKDPKVLLLKSGGMMADVKSYKVETQANISLSSLSNITASLLNGENMGSSERDDVSIDLKGIVNKGDNYQSDFISIIKSSIEKDGLTVEFKKDNNTSFATVSDFSKVFGQDIPNLGMIKLSKDKINLLSPKLPLGLGGQARDLEVYQSILGGILEENEKEIANAFSQFINEVKISKKGQEIIHGSDTYHYIITADKAESKKLFGQLVNIILKDTPSESKVVLDNLIGSINIDTFDVWLGKEDNNLHQYKITLKIPLSKVINYENKGISNSQIIFNLQSTYYDFDVVNQISIPADAIEIDQLLNIIKDSIVKETALTFKKNARSLFNAEGNFGNKSNNSGLCDQPESGSVFSPVGHLAGASTAVGEIAQTMKNILKETNYTGICYSTSKAWAMALPLIEHPGEYYCLDNTNDSPKITPNLLMSNICQ